MNDAAPWFVGDDAVSYADRAEIPAVLAKDGVTLDPSFQEASLSCAAVVGGLTTSAPSTTPIAWTRGLQSDGTWAKNSPYGGDGGYVVFLDGMVRWYRNLSGPDDRLTRYSDGQPTSNIMETLPPGARVDESPLPTSVSLKWRTKAALAKARWRYRFQMESLACIVSTLCFWVAAARKWRVLPGTAAAVLYFFAVSYLVLSLCDVRE